MNKEEPSKKKKLFGLIPTAAIVLAIDITLLFYKSAEMPGSNKARIISMIVIIFIGVLFILGLKQLIKKNEKFASFASSIPGQMTSLGILGTFAGIFIGLYNFDVHNLNQSVPLLLEGMKVAFSTSIAGLVSSIGLKISHSVIISITQEDPYESSINHDNFVLMSPELEKNLSDLNSSIWELTNEMRFSNDYQYDNEMKTKYGENYKENEEYKKKMQQDKAEQMKYLDELYKLFAKNTSFGQKKLY